MRETLLALLAANAAWTAFAWGLFKALIPFPTPSLMLLAGAEIARSGTGAGAASLIVLWRLALPGAAGGVLGAYPYYWLARRGGWPVVESWAPWLGIRRSRLNAWHLRWTARKGKLELLLGAAAMISLLLGALLAGLGEAGFWEYAFWAFLGGAIRFLILGLAGWKLRAYGDPAVLFGRGAVAAGLLLAVLIALFVGYRRHREARGASK